MNYDMIARYKLAGGKKHRLGSCTPRRCRYCLRQEPATCFKKIAHAIPECLGNRTLISHDECDHCNDRFSQTIEDHLDKFTQPLRTVLGIKGKNGVPVFKSRDGKLRVELNAKARHFTILDKEGAGILIVDEGNRTLTLDDEVFGGHSP